MAYRGDGSRNRGGGRGDSAQPGGRGNADRGGRGRDTSGAQGGGLGRTRGGLVGDSETAKRNRERTGFRDPVKDAKDRARGYKAGTLAPDEVPTYDKLPTLGQLMSAVGMAPTSPTGALTAIGSVAGAASLGDPFGRTSIGRSVDEATGAEPGNYSGGTNISRDSGRYGGTGTSGGGKTDIDAEAEERKKRRLAAQQTALGADPNSLLGPGVLAI